MGKMGRDGDSVGAKGIRLKDAWGEMATRARKLQDVSGEMPL